MSHPILYSLRQCPYAMRARLGLLLAEQTVILRDIIMTNIPNEMFTASAKGTVPVLVFDENAKTNENGATNESKVIDESLDIMVWALQENDPHNLLYSQDEEMLPKMLALIERSDTEFVEALKKYKAASRYHDDAEIECRQQCETFISEFEQSLIKVEFLMGAQLSLVDYAILPFIRQFSRVDKKWYQQAPYPKLRSWLERHYQNPVFSKAMKKYPQWLETKDEIIFG